MPHYDPDMKPAVAQPADKTPTPTSEPRTTASRNILGDLGIPGSVHLPLKDLRSWSNIAAGPSQRNGCPGFL